MRSGNAAEDGRRKYLTRVKYFWKIWKYHGNLAVMNSKGGGHNAGIRGHGGHGKAFDASRPNLSSDEVFCQNSVGAAACSKDGGFCAVPSKFQNSMEVAKICEISLNY